MLKAAVKSLEEVNEAHRALYKETDDGKGGKLFVLQVEAAHGFANEDITGLKNAVGTLRGENDDLKKAVKKFDGIEDPKAARDALARVKDLEGFDPQKDAEKIANTKLEAMKAELVKKHSEDLKSREDRLALYKRNLERLSIDDEIDRAVSGLLADQKLELQDGANGDIRALLRTSIRHEFDDESGTVKIKVVDDKGVERIADSQGRAMGLKDAVSELPKTRAYLFKSTGAAGMGTKSQQGPGGPGPKKLSEMSNAEKSAYIGEHGIAKFKESLAAERASKPSGASAGGQ